LDCRKQTGSLDSIFVAAQKIETVNGVRVIHNEKGGKWGANPEVKLELIRTIGGLDAEENLSRKSGPPRAYHSTSLEADKRPVRANCFTRSAATRPGSPGPLHLFPAVSISLHRAATPVDVFRP